VRDRRRVDGVCPDQEIVIVSDAGHGLTMTCEVEEPFYFAFASTASRLNHG
jgi:hypothetical protein